MIGSMWLESDELRDKWQSRLLLEYGPLVVVSRRVRIRHFIVAGEPPEWVEENDYELTIVPEDAVDLRNARVGQPQTPEEIGAMLLQDVLESYETWANDHPEEYARLRDRDEELTRLAREATGPMLDSTPML